ncbi:MAG: T9SS type A sorting domain-containing protein [Bacteroidaceae bacterium]|nr:T9SS type A sorting domain-containing protein [Bacteroidaceae bacterium]
MVRTLKLFAFVSLLSIIRFAYPTSAKAAYGDWTIYAAYHHATKVAVLNKIVYVLSDNGLYSYDPEDTHVETYDKTNVLSDNHIINMVYCDATKQIVLLYGNGNIDMMDAKGNVYNMPELKGKALPDKTLNDLYVHNENIYISTNSGIVVLDTKRKVFANYYDLGQKVNSVIVDNGTIVAVTSGGVYKGQMKDNLLDANSWEKASSNVFSKIVIFNNHYYACAQNNKRLKIITDKENLSYNNTTDDAITDYCVANDMLLFFGNNHIIIIDKDNNYKAVDNTLSAQHAEYVGGKYWMACNTNGLMQASLDEGAFKETVASIIPNSPFYNYFYNLTMINGRLLAVGGYYEFESSTVRPAFATQYDNGVWTNFDETLAFEGMGGSYYYRNFNGIVQDPNDPTHHFVSARAGIVEYKDYKFVKHYDHKNSPLIPILPNSSHASYYNWTGGLTYDSQDNLWMLCCCQDTTIRVMKADGTWQSYYYEELVNSFNVNSITIDQRGWMWICNRFSSVDKNAGLFIVNMNGTLNQRSDDRTRWIDTFNNQDGTSYHAYEMNCAVEDLKGAIWIGTDLGPFVTFDPSTVFSSDFYFTQCKVPRNDGTNYADYLLSEIDVRCITVDGGNRKWIGTIGNGVYLVNEDGSAILEHFTIDNSPLISNDIYSIAIDGSSGEVFFATENGLVSYMGNAVDPEESFDKDLVKAYPNPVKPDYTGNVIITGLMNNSVVKIVNAAGRLVKEGTSVGGAFSWDRLTTEGKQAAAGVYYVLATDADGDNGVATKFLIVR